MPWKARRIHALEGNIDPGAMIENIEGTDTEVQDPQEEVWEKVYMPITDMWSFFLNGNQLYWITRKDWEEGIASDGKTYKQIYDEKVQDSRDFSDESIGETFLQAFVIPDYTVKHGNDTIPDTQASGEVEEIPATSPEDTDIPPKTGMIYYRNHCKGARMPVQRPSRPAARRILSQERVTPRPAARRILSQERVAPRRVPPQAPSDRVVQSLRLRVARLERELSQLRIASARRPLASRSQPRPVPRPLGRPVAARAFPPRLPLASRPQPRPLGRPISARALPARRPFAGRPRVASGWQDSFTAWPNTLRRPINDLAYEQQVTGRKQNLPPGDATRGYQNWADPGPVRAPKDVSGDYVGGFKVSQRRLAEIQARRAAIRARRRRQAAEEKEKEEPLPERVDEAIETMKDVLPLVDDEGAKKPEKKEMPATPEQVETAVALSSDIAAITGKTFSPRAAKQQYARYSQPRIAQTINLLERRLAESQTAETVPLVHTATRLGAPLIDDSRLMEIPLK